MSLSSFVCSAVRPFVLKEFLAAMSSSRSDDVTKFVCLSVCVSVVILSCLEYSNHLKLDVSRVL